MNRDVLELGISIVTIITAYVVALKPTTKKKVVNNVFFILMPRIVLCFTSVYIYVILVKDIN